MIWNLSETYALLGRTQEAERGFAEGLVINPHAHFFSLACATIDLRQRGELAPMREALGRIPRDFDPAAGSRSIALRLSLLERDAAEGARILAASTHERYNDTGLVGFGGILDGYSFPRAWIEGLVARVNGQRRRSRVGPSKPR